MRLLVSGATGTIGRTLLRHAIRRGFEVVALTRRPEAAAQLDALGGAKVVPVVWHPRSGPAASIGRVDAAVHLAASLDHFGDEAALWQSNVALTESFFRLAESAGSRRFVFASSIEAVGPVRAEECPVPEDTKILPASPYGQSKRAAEKTLERVSAASPQQAVSARIGNVYGPDANGFVEAVKAELRGSGPLNRFRGVLRYNRLHPVHIDDVAEGLLSLVAAPAPAPVYNLCGPRSIEFDELAAVAGPAPAPAVPSLADRARVAAHRMRCRWSGSADLLCYLAGEGGGRSHREFRTDRLETDTGFRAQIPFDAAMIS